MDITHAREPGELPRLFLRALNAGDADAVVALYEPDGIIALDTRTVCGRDAIREMVAGVLAQHAAFSLRHADAVQAGDIAVIRSRWTISIPDAESSRISDHHVSPTLVARRQPDGAWLVVVDRQWPLVYVGVALPVLPAIDLAETGAFYQRLGFSIVTWSEGDEGYAILSRGDLELHFFAQPALDPRHNGAATYWRVTDADALHAECMALELPSRGAPSVGAIGDTDYGMREFALVDPNGNLIRIGHDRSD